MTDQAPAAWRLVHAIHWTNLFLAESAVHFVNTYPLDKKFEKPWEIAIRFLYEKDKPSEICHSASVWLRSSVGCSAQLISRRHGFEFRRGLVFSGFFSATSKIAVHLRGVFLRSNFIQRWNETDFIKKLWQCTYFSYPHLNWAWRKTSTSCFSMAQF